MTTVQSENFDSIWKRAVQRKGSQANLESLLQQPLSKEQLSMIPDDRWLSTFTSSIFKSGFVWRVIDNKWPNFERAFFGFEIEKMLLLNEQHIERLASDASIVRNLQKISTVSHNAQLIHRLAIEHGSFAKFIAQWPDDDFVGLCLMLKKQGARLGGNTAAYSMRRMGKDAFVLSNDVTSQLIAQGVVEKTPSSQRDMRAVQAYFNQLRIQSGRSLTEISQTIAYSVGDNYV
ncbi:DNA-3-methyladenine glycosylase I [Alginatibacterium sediminis]|uniref:DNA-3-methyladenine glycosylase I n=1 Tax=Alginatibacterium sediminis TaxID=2164068 RepID=A0A420EHK5_9ALTE|nr:DNA-3-methyladenine glycosylase I [Alginatibacterium sediminis]RKF20148.1 DNA-3-methyladenine glycosylase I [Alginatibacterium sediminis]